MSFALDVDDRPALRIASRNAARLVVTPTRREFPDAVDCDDGNWIYATIVIAAGGFKAEIEAMLRSEEFARFRDKLRPLNSSLVGSAKFETMEGWLSVCTRT